LFNYDLYIIALHNLAIKDNLYLASKKLYAFIHIDISPLKDLVKVSLEFSRLIKSEKENNDLPTFKKHGTLMLY
jgi:hypothetical protein